MACAHNNCCCQHDENDHDETGDHALQDAVVLEPQGCCEGATLIADQAAI